MPKGSKSEVSGENEDEEVREDGVLFYVNKDGFPIGEHTWKRMWRHVAKLHPEGKTMVNQLRGTKNLPEVPVPQAPVNFPLNTIVSERLDMVQKYMSELQYNHTGTQFFEIRKARPLSGLMDTAREMIREALPIKCLEAVILATHLTNGMPGVDRFTISFKTTFAGHTHRHVVLGVFYSGKYGALGMSRRQDLMYKPLHFKTLPDLILDFISCYKNYWHEVRKVKIGLPIPHDPHIFEPIVWKNLNLNLQEMDKEDMCRALERHGREMRAQIRRQTALTAVYTPHKLRSLTTVADSPKKPSGSQSQPATPANNASSSKASRKSKTTKSRKSPNSNEQQGKIVHQTSGPSDQEKSTHTNSADVSDTTKYQVRI